VVGVLDATSRLDRASPVAGTAVFAAARAIEGALRAHSFARSGGDIVTRLLARISDPALLVTPTGRITHANRAAVDLELQLGPHEQRVDGLFRVRRSLQDVLGLDVASLGAVADGRADLPFIEVEAVRDPEDRIAAWLVLMPQKRPAAPVAPPKPFSIGPFRRIAGSDAGLRRTLSFAARLADSELPLLVLGDTGTGKELLARAIHDASPRAGGPFVAVNCAAIAPGLLHSELFGYRGGAFTGADPTGRDGQIAAASGGTLFLDELAEMPMALQALLLRVLEQGTYRRVGASAESEADVRIVCATCRDLPGLVEAGAFRSDLYFRLHGATLALPSLAERSDLQELVDALLASLAREAGCEQPRIRPSARTALEQHAWPGNIRELRMTLHRAMVLAGPGGTLETSHLMLHDATPTAEPAARASGSASLEDQRVQAIHDALARHDGNVSAAARELGVARSTVYRILQRSN
jgi:transcriptional regulator of acetoin/glycerol metabolism